MCQVKVTEPINNILNEMLSCIVYLGLHGDQKGTSKLDDSSFNREKASSPRRQPAVLQLYHNPCRQPPDAERKPVVSRPTLIPSSQWGWLEHMYPLQPGGNKLCFCFNNGLLVMRYRSDKKLPQSIKNVINQWIACTEFLCKKVTT